VTQQQLTCHRLVAPSFWEIREKAARLVADRVAGSCIGQVARIARKNPAFVIAGNCIYSVILKQATALVDVSGTIDNVTNRHNEVESRACKELKGSFKKVIF